MAKTSPSKQERQWQVQDAMTTIQRAEQLKKDKPLMQEVKKCAADLQKAVGRAPTPRKRK